MLYKKRWHTPWKFQLEITNNKKVIAQKPLTNLYGMNSRRLLLYYMSIVAVPTTFLFVFTSEDWEDDYGWVPTNRLSHITTDRAKAVLMSSSLLCINHVSCFLRMRVCACVCVCVCVGVGRWVCVCVGAPFILRLLLEFPFLNITKHGEITTIFQFTGNIFNL